MQEITMKRVLSWKLDKDRRDPRPFPGNYPTRWLIAVGYYTPRVSRKQPRVHHRKFTYFGKPNRAVASRIYLMMTRGMVHGTLLFYEFDRGGLIKHGAKDMPMSRMGVEEYVVPLAALYYYNGGVASSMFDGWENGAWAARMRVKGFGKPFTAYHNGAEMSPENMEDHKTWVDGLKLQWAK